MFHSQLPSEADKGKQTICLKRVPNHWRLEVKLCVCMHEELNQMHHGYDPRLKGSASQLNSEVPGELLFLEGHRVNKR